jgi:transposase-like protein
LIVYWDADQKQVQGLRYSTGEYAWEIAKDLRVLKEAGVVLASVTSDGGRGIKRAVELEYPHIPHQRCLVHLQRHTLAWITQNPRTEAGRQIRPLMQALAKIDEEEEKQRWAKAFQTWCLKWEQFLKQRTYAGDRGWWYTHKSLRRVRAAILNALPNMFHSLTDKTIPRDGNGLEGRFSPFKQHYRQHRGLSPKRRLGYIVWYIRLVVNG